MAVALVVALEILSLLGVHIPMPFAPFVFGAFILAIGHEVLLGGLKALLRLNFASINLLMLIAVIGAFYLGEYPEAAVVVVLYVLGERLEEIGIESSKAALDALIAKAPKTATLKSSGEQMAIDKVPVGSVIAVKPHDMIPLDGMIVSGETAVDEAPITGEPLPKDKHKGDAVFAGTLNKSGYIEVETTKTSADTTFSKIVRLTFEAQANKSETQKFIQRFSKIYTPAIILMAVALFVIPVFFFGQPLEKWLNSAITLLVIACPCALVISTPVAIYAAIGNASEKGALVKGGKYIEALARLRAVGMDKTRTITFGKPVVSDVLPLGGTSREELLACSAGTEIFSEHPLAQAIVDASRREGFEPHEAEAFKSIMGKGATAKCLVCEDEQVFLGKLSFIKELMPVSPEVEKTVAELSRQGKTSVVVSFNKDLGGVLGITDEIKPDSQAAVKQLQELSVEPIMLTGDSAESAWFVATQVGINQVFGNLLPEDKAKKIKELNERYTYVGMVGDGVNDAPALALSSVGIAMGAAGSDTAIETANVALMNDNLSLIPFLIRLSKATLRRIHINTIGAILVKLVFITLAFFGMSNLVLAIAADVGVTLVVIVLSLGLLRFK